MQKWTVKQDGALWLVLHNGKEVRRSNSEAGAWKNAWRRASTSAQKRGVTPALIGDEITVVGGDRLTSAELQVARAARLKAAATVAGFSSIDSLVKAINARQVIVLRNHEVDAESEEVL